jgi:hypothetical protein
MKWIFTTRYIRLRATRGEARDDLRRERDAESAKWHISEHLRWHIHTDGSRRRLPSLWLINRSLRVCRRRRPLLLLSIAPRAGSPPNRLFPCAYLFCNCRASKIDQKSVSRDSARPRVRSSLKKSRMREWDLRDVPGRVGRAAQDCVSHVVINDCLLLKAHFHGSDKFYCRRLFHSLLLCCTTRLHTI